MNIINTILTKIAEETTANAIYTIEYIAINGALNRIHASIQSLSTEEAENKNLGYITFENETIFSNIVGTIALSPIFEDFERFMRTIRESMNPEADTKNQK